MLYAGVSLVRSSIGLEDFGHLTGELKRQLDAL
jgi:cystathionine beta-lyase/cystathionine gamma-synthase